MLILIIVTHNKDCVPAGYLPGYNPILMDGDIMQRECSMEDISDGRLYGPNDMVRADTGMCPDCSRCCTNVGNTIVLDPFDLWRMKKKTGKNVQELIDSGKIELNVVDGLILPDIAMDKDNKCGFLSDKGRCSIHDARPGICRLFPLGRIYSEDDFSYFLQTDECPKSDRTKIKVKKWLDEKNIELNHIFIKEWHFFIKDIGNRLCQLKKQGKGEIVNEITMFILNSFFVSDIAAGEENNQGQDIYVIEKMIYEALINRIHKAKKIIYETYGLI